MPSTETTTSVEDKARAFLANGWDALNVATGNAPKVMDKQVVYLKGLTKKKSRKALSTEQIRLVQRLVKGNGTKEEASEMISLLTKQQDGSDTIADFPEATEPQQPDIEQAKDEVRALLQQREAAQATFESLSVIAEPAHPMECVYCNKGEDEHAREMMHDFEGPEPEAVLSHGAALRLLSAEAALSEWFEKNRAF